jgi:hypothetical protein
MDRSRLGLIAAALLLISGGCRTRESSQTVQDSNEGTAYTFREGTKWTFSVTKNEATDDGTLTVRVTKSEKGRNVLSYEKHDLAGKLVTSSEEIHWIENGGLWFATIVDGKSHDAQMLYKFGSKQGESWVNAAGDTTATHEGRAEVEVPAGAYKDAIQIKVSSDADRRVVANYWLVPKVGLVKWTAGPITMQLKKFEEP